MMITHTNEDGSVCFGYCCSCPRVFVGVLSLAEASTRQKSIVAESTARTTPSLSSAPVACLHCSASTITQKKTVSCCLVSSEIRFLLEKHCAMSME